MPIIVPSKNIYSYNQKKVKNNTIKNIEYRETEYGVDINDERQIDVSGILPADIDTRNEESDIFVAVGYISNFDDEANSVSAGICGYINRTEYIDILPVDVKQSDNEYIDSIYTTNI